MGDILGYSTEVVDHIVRFCDQNDLPPVPMLAMGIQESGLRPDAAGDLAIGGSFGVFQVYLKAHGHDAAYWQGIDGLDRSMAEMRARWHEAFITCGGWQAVVSDLVGFTMQFAPQAQGSVEWGDALARLRVSQAVAVYALYLKQQTPPPDDRLPVAIDGLTLAKQGLDELVRRLGEAVDAEKEGIDAVLARLK